METVDNMIEVDATRSKTKLSKKKKVVTQNVELKVQKLSVEEKSLTVGNNAITLPLEVVGTDEHPVQISVAQYKGLSNLIGVPRFVLYTHLGEGHFLNLS